MTRPPASASEARPTTLKKSGSVDTSTFSTESTLSRLRRRAIFAAQTGRKTPFRGRTIPAVIAHCKRVSVQSCWLGENDATALHSDWKTTQIGLTGVSQGQAAPTPKTARRPADAAAGQSEPERLRRELNEALERETATAEILASIRESTSDTRPVFEAILDNLLRLFGTRFALDSPCSGRHAARRRNRRRARL